MLISCQRYELAPRDIEIIGDHSTMGYIARTHYNRALRRLNGAGINIAFPLVHKKVDICVSGEARSLINGQYFVIEPRNFLIEHNHCKIIQLLDKAQSQAVPLQLCYVGRSLYVDPDPDDSIEPFASSIFNPSIMWDVGAGLSGIQTTGIASLRHSTLRVQYVEQ